MGVGWGYHIVRGICRQGRPRSAVGIGWKGQRRDHWLVGRGGGGGYVVRHRKGKLGDPLTIASPFFKYGVILVERKGTDNPYRWTRTRTKLGLNPSWTEGFCGVSHPHNTALISSSPGSSQCCTTGTSYELTGQLDCTDPDWETRSSKESTAPAKRQLGFQCTSDNQFRPPWRSTVYSFRVVCHKSMGSVPVA